MQVETNKMQIKFYLITSKEKKPPGFISDIEDHVVKLAFMRVHM